MQRLFRANQHQQLFRPGDASIEHIPSQHHIVSHQNQRYDDGIFRVLGLVNGGRIGQGQFIQLCSVILDQPVIELHRERPVLPIHLLNDADIAVEYFLLIVVLDLYDLVVLPVGHAAPGQVDWRWIESILQQDIQLSRTYGPPLHGRQHLNGAGRHMVGFRKSALDQIHDLIRDVLGIFVLKEKEIRLPAIGDIRIPSSVDVVGVHDDPAALGLPENLRQLDHRRTA